MKVLSLFDGCGCAYQAFKNLGITVERYYASEVDKYAIKVAEKNHPDIEHIGDVKNVSYQYGDMRRHRESFIPVSMYTHIDLLIGGPPCQDLSIAGKRKGLDGERSGLFREYVRILREVKPKRFIMENVASMSKENRDIISKELGVEPIIINSALVTAQNRKRLYRTNIPGVTQPENKEIFLKDIVLDQVEEKYYISKETMEKLSKYESNSRISPLEGKSYCLNTMQGGHRQPKILCNTHPSGKGMNGNVYGLEGKFPTITTNKGEGPKIVQRARGFNKGGEHHEKSPTVGSSFREQNNMLHDSERIRKLTPRECEALQGLPYGYTEGVSNAQRYKMIGNCFTVTVIQHILSFIKL